ncbi:MAG: Nramp family divalent metal transporter [Planctomycetales bacterium]
MGISLLLTTELGVLDASARISADIVKVNYLRNNPNWSQSRLYFLFLWGSIVTSIGILIAGLNIANFREPLFLLKTSAAMNGGVMLIYTILLLYLNTKILSRSVAVSAFRFTMMMWSCAFFGYFTCMALRLEVIPFAQEFFLWVDDQIWGL